ncbi:MAG: hypothetical protein M1839_008109 [Geoglossum umbratile]|nr:MAG: hypothetical protein M1839_008109 [Geoglossum umbratile]
MSSNSQRSVNQNLESLPNPDLHSDYSLQNPSFTSQAPQHYSPPLDPWAPDLLEGQNFSLGLPDSPVDAEHSQEFPSGIYHVFTLAPHPTQTSPDPAPLFHGGAYNSYHRHPPQHCGSGQTPTQSPLGSNPLMSPDLKWASGGSEWEPGDSGLGPPRPIQRQVKAPRSSTKLGSTSSQVAQGSPSRVQKRQRKGSTLPASIISLLKCGLRINGGRLPNQRQLDLYSELTGVNPQDLSASFKELARLREMETDSAYSTMPDLLSLARTMARAIWNECPKPKKGNKVEGGPFRCTWCPISFAKKGDWKRHEECRYPQGGWACPICYSKDRTVRIMRTRDKLSQHVRLVHKDSQMPSDSKSYFPVGHESKFPCGRCTEEFLLWTDRIDHIFNIHPNPQGDKGTTDPDDDPSGDSDRGPEDGPEGGSSDYFDQASGDPGARGYPDGQGSGRNGRGGGPQGFGEGGSAYDQQQFQLYGCQSASMLESGPKPTLPALTQTHFYTSDPSPHIGSVLLPLERRPFKQRLDPQLKAHPYRQPPSPPRTDSELPLKRNYGEKGLSPSLKTELAWLRPRRKLTLSHPLPFISVRDLGHGASGSVDQIYWKDTRRVFARKIIRLPSRSMLSQFLKEVEIMKRLLHAHLVALVGSYIRGREFAIIMNPAADCDLGDYMENFSLDNHEGERQLCRWYSCLVSGLKYMHDNSIRHKDIKPRNILVHGENILFCDFGISRSFPHDGSTTSGCGPVTRVYAPPEVSQEKRPGRSADIWSLGCVFLEMATVLTGMSVREFHDSRTAASTRDPADASYFANLPTVMNWITILRHRNPQFRVSQALNLCTRMLSEHSRRRPDVHHLTDVFPPKRCCGAPVEYFDWGRPIASRQSTHTHNLKTPSVYPDSTSRPSTMTDGESEPSPLTSGSGSPGTAPLPRWRSTYGIHRFLNEHESADWSQYREQPCVVSAPLQSLMESKFDHLLRRQGWWENADRMGHEPGVDMSLVSERLHKLTLWIELSGAEP